ncbi:MULTISPECIES: hypothetical protein [Paraburkholderia]|uniref:hypothetical protein n=1 Tax=Paraburkholderia TaxID=1822464 RepID=UPI0008A790BD|nr:MULTISPECIES: hypothetical protein [Paraburkholderia]SEI15481.1 hypothetical protein SAMN05192544_102677 [Paraburkholderia hospita]
MTMRTTRHFFCQNGHDGAETTSENDQPYSQQWESVRTAGLIDAGKDPRGYAHYVCAECGAPMREKA